MVSGVDGISDDIGDPAVEALAVFSRLSSCPPMQIRGNTQVETSGIRLFRGFSFCGAELKVIFHGIFQSNFKLINGTALKRNDIVQVENF